jgi:thymidylate synthase
MSEETPSIFKYITTDEFGNHTILPENFNALLKDKSFDTSKLEVILTGDQFPEGLKPKLVVGLKTRKDPLPYYRPSVKEAIYTYRDKNRNKYNEKAREYYIKKSEDTEWKKALNEKQKVYNAKYRERNKPTEEQLKQKQEEKEKKRLEREASKPPKKPRGRPRKTFTS